MTKQNDDYFLCRKSIPRRTPQALRESDIVHENGRYWVARERFKGREIFTLWHVSDSGTHSVKVGTYDLGLLSRDRAIAACDARAVAASRAAASRVNTFRGGAAETPRPGPSILAEAAMSWNTETATQILRDALCLPSSTHSAVLSSDFTSATEAQRLVMIASFLTAECHAQIERGAELVDTPSDLSATLNSIGCD